MTAQELMTSARSFGQYPLPLPFSTVAELVADRGQKTAGAPFLTTISPNGEPETLTFGRFAKHALSAAAWLREKHGVRPRDIVACGPRNDRDSVIMMFGALCAGAALLMLNPEDPPARLETQLQARTPVLVLGELPGGITVPTGVANMGVPREPNPLTAADPAFLFHTSGSTAVPKAVIQSHEAAIVNAVAFSRRHDLKSGESMLGFLPLHHTNAVHTNLMGSLMSGAHCVLFPGLSVLDFPSWIESFRPAVISMVPSAIEALLTVWRDPRVPDSLRHVLSAAAPLAAATARRFLERTGRLVVQGYGLTETVNFSTTLPPGLDLSTYRRLMIDTEIPSVGLPMWGTEVFASGPDGRLPVGEEGELCMRGRSMMTGYLDDAAATAAAFAGGVFHSGDIGRVVSDPVVGEHVVITGRIKNIAKVRGEQVSLEEIERTLTGAPGILDAGCVSVTEPLEGERILAAIVASPGFDESVVREHLSRILSPFASPRELVRVPGIPRTSTGKLRRVELAAMLEHGCEAGPR